MNRFKLLSALTALVLITVVSASSVDAQSRMFTPANHGLGGGGTAYLDSYHANFINPANLMLNHDRRPKRSVGLAAFSASAGGSLINIETYNKYLTSGLTISGTVADEMLNNWFGTNIQNDRSLDLEIGIIPLGIALRGKNSSYSLAVRNRMLANVSMSRGMAELFFYGPDPEIFKNGRPVNIGMESLAFTEISFGYARKLWGTDNLIFGRDAKLYIGVAPKLLLAQNTQRIAMNSTIFARSNDHPEGGQFRHDLNYTIETIGELADGLRRYNQDRQSGNYPNLDDYIDAQPNDFYDIKNTSLGLDIGLTLEMDISHLPLPNRFMFKGPKKLRAGFSVSDMGSVNFKDNLGQFLNTQQIIFNGFDFDREMIDRDFDGDEGKYFESVIADSIGNEQYLGFDVNDPSSFRRGLPTTMNFGAHLQLGKISAMLDFGKGLNNRGINSNRAYMAMGLEYKFINRIPLRVGMRTGGHTSTSYHVGTGIELRNLEFTVSASAVAKSGEYGSGIGAAWSGLILHF